MRNYTTTNLIWAIEQGDICEIENCKKSGVNFNPIIFKHYTPLTYAIFLATSQVFQFEKKPSKNMEISNQETAPFIKTPIVKYPIVKPPTFHLPHPNPEYNFKKKITKEKCPIISQKKSLEIIEALINCGSEVKALNQQMIKFWFSQDARIRSPLFSAMAKQNIPILELLLNYGADIEESLTQGGTLLMNSLLFKDNRVSHYLIDRGAQLNTPNKGQYPLIEACKKIGSFRFLDSNLETIKKLIINGANVENYEEQTGDNALMVACTKLTPGIGWRSGSATINPENLYMPIVELLMNLNSMNHKNKSGACALDIAKYINNENLKQCLEAQHRVLIERDFINKNLIMDKKQDSKDNKESLKKRSINKL